MSSPGSEHDSFPDGLPQEGAENPFLDGDDAPEPLLPGADCRSLSSLSDLSENCVGLLRFVHGDVLDSELRGARWADELRIWEAVERADAERLLSPRGAAPAAIVVPDPLPKRGASPAAGQPLAILAERLTREPALVPLDERATSVADPRLLFYGPESTAVIQILRRGSRLDDYEVGAIADLVPDLESDLVELRSHVAEAHPGMADRIELALAGCMPRWATPTLLQIPWLAALATLAGAQEHRILTAWRDVALTSDGAGEWFRSVLWVPPVGHPVGVPGDVDFGPNRSAFVAFYGRSGVLTKAETIRLVEAWTDQPWRGDLPADAPIADWWGSEDAPYGRLREVGTTIRPHAYAIARRLGHMRLPHKARLAIKDAAAAIVLADLISADDYDAMTAVWRRSGVADW